MESSSAFTANKVFFEFWPNKGFYRVRVHYTIPELKEAREARVEFTSKKEAEKYYLLCYGVLISISKIQKQSVLLSSRQLLSLGSYDLNLSSASGLQ